MVGSAGEAGVSGAVDAAPEVGAQAPAAAVREAGNTGVSMGGVSMTGVSTGGAASLVAGAVGGGAGCGGVRSAPPC